MKKFLIIIIILSSINVFSQNDSLSIQRNLLKQDEISTSFKLSTNGWGFDYRRGYIINMHQKNLYEIQFNTIKHPKEEKIPSVFYTFKSFIYGKENECFDLRFGLGKQYLLFDKKTPGTVGIRLFGFVGGDMAFLKPIYYVIMVNQNNWDSVTEKYKPSHQPATIEKKASFWMGFDEIKINPGIYAKLGTSFEYSKTTTFLNSLEFGLESYLFLNRLEIMGELDNPRFIVSMYVSYRIGVLIENKHKPKETGIGF